jgi:hypothetical protein
MPTFPTYRGEMPAVLSPLNPRHYWLLAYWIYFRPTALKCYLYTANFELYQLLSGVNDSTLWKRLWNIIRTPAYRNLKLMTPALIVLPNLLVILLISLTASIPVAWFPWAIGVAIGYSYSFFMDITDLTGNIYLGFLLSVLFGVFGGVVLENGFAVFGNPAVIVIVSLLSGYSFNLISGAFGEQSTELLPFGVIFGLGWGLVASAESEPYSPSVMAGITGALAGLIGQSRAFFWPFQVFLAIFARNTSSPVR